MLVVAGRISIDPAHVDLLRSAAATMMEATLEEPGCIEYVFSVSVADPGNVQVFEIWESAEDLEKHFKMPHMATFRETLGQVTITGRDPYRYQVASREPM